MCSLTSILELTFELIAPGDDIYNVSLRNGEVQSRATILGQQDNGRQIKRVLPGPINHCQL